MRIGSLFSGAGGLDMAVEQVFGGHIVWHCENDSAASKVLAHRWSDVPNLGDITAVDWTRVELVDVLCGGWPCQPFSLAGKRKGTEDERALWPYVAGAVRMVRPRYVVLENVSAVLGPEFQRVASDLASLGYDIAWTCLRASDVGAPHRRERVFVVAVTHGAAVGQPPRGASTEETRSEQSHRLSDHRGERTTRNGGVAADSSGDGRHEGRPEPARLIGGSDAAVSGAGPVNLLPTPAAARSGNNQSLSPGAAIRPSLDSINDLNRSGARKDELLPGQARDMAAGWGKYESAIRRWEHLTRPAPTPTELNTKGNPRLNPAFSEWMMGWPEGWVTDVPGISRNDQLRIIGNGVVPQCAAAALRWLLSVSRGVGLTDSLRTQA